MAYFRTCPDCGCALDPGEKCDCKDEKEKQEEAFRKMFTVTPKTGQMAFIMEEFGYAKAAM